MSRRKSPYVVGNAWLEKRRDGRSPNIWQIARKVNGTVNYKSTRKVDLDEAKAALDAYHARERGLVMQENDQAEVAVILFHYFLEVGRNLINSDQTQRSIITFIAFMLQDEIGVRAVVTDLTPNVFERFREWRMAPHSYSVPWLGKDRNYSSVGVAGSTVQRNLNDIRAAIYHAEHNMRITVAPKIKDIPMRYRSAPRSRILTEDELAQIVWYSTHNKKLFRFVALQLATSVRPTAAQAFDPRDQFDNVRGLIDLQPRASPQTKKRNAIIPAIRPLKVILRAWANEANPRVGSQRTAWRNMRRVLNLSGDVFPKTIRYTVATWLYEMEWVPERQISEMLGHSDSGSTGLVRTSRIYAQYRPERMGKVVKGLTEIWRQISRKARKFGMNHRLTSGQRGDPLEVVRNKSL